ncbi:lycopene cyclase domain-containing protein [Arthrobacter sp. 08Y14]|uniref:lycopene cyclase domain-containing protein n=1 Tax=Arthrobacter sp. 08Y14 TaxID=2058885 RepID=UPI000CE57BC7|nr:lycopene cyclase domain-containing protein [Arthrobacter sp. 08Y14]
MTYWALNAVFLVPAAVVLLFALMRRTTTTTAGGRKGVLAALGITAVVLLLLTAVFDNVMIAAGLFWYNPERISGAFIGRAPLEDFAYTVAAVLLLPALWMLLGRRNNPLKARNAAINPQEKQ